MSKKRSTATRRSEAAAASTRAAAIRKEHERKERRRRTLAVSAVVAVVLLVVLAIGYGVQSSRDASGQSAAAPAGVVGGGYAVPAGPDSAPIKVTVYEDFLCPYCGQFEAASSAQLSEDLAAGRVQFQYHALNFLDRQTSSQYSSRAANALGVVLDASGSEVAKKFHDLLFQNQPAEGGAGLNDTQIIDLAVRAGASRSEVKPGIEDVVYQKWVDNVTDQSSKDGVTGTPTVMIDGKALKSTSTDGLVQEIQKAIDAAQ